jgi:hypothetical protein
MIGVCNVVARLEIEALRASLSEALKVLGCVGRWSGNCSDNSGVTSIV